MRLPGMYGAAVLAGFHTDTLLFLRTQVLDTESPGLGPTHQQAEKPKKQNQVTESQANRSGSLPRTVSKLKKGEILVKDTGRIKAARGPGMIGFPWSSNFAAWWS